MDQTLGLPRKRKRTTHREESSDVSDDEKNANLELGECDLKEEKATPGSLGYIIIIIYDPRNLEHHLLYIMVY